MNTNNIPCVHFYFFCLRPMVRKDSCMRATSVTVMVIFQNWHFESYLIATMFKVPFQQFTKYIDNSILKNFAVDNFTDMHQYLPILSSRLKWKSMKVPWKILVVRNSESALQRTLQQNRPQFTYFFVLLSF